MTDTDIRNGSRGAKKKMTEQFELKIDDLLLDLENPRLGVTWSQSEALAGIVELNPEHFGNLMASIRDDGLDPGDSLYVIRSEDNEEDSSSLRGTAVYRR